VIGFPPDSDGCCQMPFALFFNLYSLLSVALSSADPSVPPTLVTLRAMILTHFPGSLLCLSLLGPSSPSYLLREILNSLSPSLPSLLAIATPFLSFLRSRLPLRGTRLSFLFYDIFPFIGLLASHKAAPFFVSMFSFDLPGPLPYRTVARFMHPPLPLSPHTTVAPCERTDSIFCQSFVRPPQITFPSRFDRPHHEPPPKSPIGCSIVNRVFVLTLQQLTST